MESGDAGGLYNLQDGNAKTKWKIFLENFPICRVSKVFLVLDFQEYFPRLAELPGQVENIYPFVCILLRQLYRLGLSVVVVYE